MSTGLIGTFWHHLIRRCANIRQDVVILSMVGMQCNQWQQSPVIREGMVVSADIREKSLILEPRMCVVLKWLAILTWHELGIDIWILSAGWGCVWALSQCTCCYFILFWGMSNLAGTYIIFAHSERLLYPLGCRYMFWRRS